MLSEARERIVIEYPLEELRCSLCNAYLSCSPILVLEDGNSVCGNCSSVAGEGQTYRMLKLEALLTNSLFPCRFKKHGCGERPVFGHVEEHEDQCEYQTIACPCPAEESCAWEGATIALVDHFSTAHPAYVAEHAEFQIAVGQDVKGLLIVSVNNVVFALIFEYSAHSSNLQYHVNYFTKNVQDVSFKIKLINNADQDYSITLKGGDCSPFGVNSMQNPGLVLKNFLQNLNNPNLIKVAIDFLPKKCVFQDNDLLQTLKCTNCLGYLIPPLSDNGQGAICTNCSKTVMDPLPPCCKPLINNDLLERVLKANYPCYWKGCNVIVRALNFQAHIEACPLRVYECIDTTCKETFNRERATAHLEGHGCEFFQDKLKYKIVLANETGIKRAATLKNNGILLVQYNTRMDGHVVTPNAFSTDACKVNLKVEIAHEHCKSKSLYTLSFRNMAWTFSKALLPGCFKQEDELTFTLKVVSNYYDGTVLTPPEGVKSKTWKKFRTSK